MSFDVIMLTKNSISTIEESISSVYREVPVNRLIIVDGGSTDGTLELVKGFPRVEIIHDIGTRATARQKGIMAVKTEWHIHVDSDVTLAKGWYDRISPYLKDDKIGAVWGVTLPVGKLYNDILRSLARLRRTTVLQIQLSQSRYLLHDTIIRTSAVSDIKIPPDYHVQEDQFIGNHIVSKGYAWMKSKEASCFHKLSGRSESGFRKEAILSGYMYHKYHIRSFSSILRNSISAIPKSAWIFLNTLNIRAAEHHLAMQTLPLKGWLMYAED